VLGGKKKLHSSMILTIDPAEVLNHNMYCMQVALSSGVHHTFAGVWPALISSKS
jgi:hypothetical protein